MIGTALGRPPVVARTRGEVGRGPLSERTREAVLLGLAVAVPIAFNPFGVLAFEPFKIALIRLAAIVLALSCVVGGWPGTRRPVRPLVWAVGAYGGATALATVFSLQPVESLLGSYDRLQGLVTLAALVMVGWAASLARGAPLRSRDG